MARFEAPKDPKERVEFYLECAADAEKHDLPEIAEKYIGLALKAEECIE